MTGTAVQVRASRQRAEPIEAARSSTSGTRPADRSTRAWIRARTSEWAASVERERRMILICRRWKKQTPTRWLTCVVSVIALSIKTPRSLTDSVGWMSASDILTLSAGQWWRRRLERSQISSVFDGLSRRRFEDIQALTCSMHETIRTTKEEASSWATWP